MSDVPAIGYSVNIKIDDNRSIVVQTHIPQDASPEEINKTLDKVIFSVERQKLISEREAMKKVIISAEANIDELKRSIAAVPANGADNWTRSGKRGEYRPTESEQKSIAQFETGLKRSHESIKFAKEQIARIDGLIGAPDVSHSGADL